MLSRDKNFYRTFLKLAFALMMQQAVVLSVNLADNIMLGSYSETALSGVAAVNQIQFILQQLVFGFTNGMVVLASQYWGRKQTDPIRALTAIAMRGAAAVSVLLFALVSVFPRQAVGLFTEDAAIIAEGCAYLAIVRFSYLFFAVTTVLLGAMRSVEKVNIALHVSLMALVVNCSINFVLIGGRFGLPEMGVRGAAIGTLTARILECAVVARYVLAKDKRLTLRMRHLRAADFTLLRDYTRVSLPLITASFLWSLNTALQTVILGHLSASAIAAHSISSTIFLFLKVASVGASSAAAVITGRTVGEGDWEKIRVNTRTMQVIFVCIGAVLGAILLFIRMPLLSLYALSDETRSLAQTFMLIEATVLVTMSYQMCTNTGIISGGGDTRFVLVMDLIAIWCFVMPLSLLCAFRWNASPVIVLLMLNADQYLKCIPAAIHCNSYRWVKKLTRET